MIPLPIKRALYKVYSEHVPRALGRILGPAGYNVSRRKDFYSPLPTVPMLKKNEGRWNRPSELKGLNYDLGSMKRLFDDLLAKYLDEFSAIPPYVDLHSQGFGLGYTPVDALTLYLMIRHIKPKRYIEVGSGLSTYYCSLAGTKNREQGFPLEITCIEPYPLEKLNTLPNIEIIAREVQDVELSLFDRLEENDVFFIDSSHSLRIDGDVPFLYLEVLPRISKGTYVHIHDIPFPFNFPFPPEHWIFGKKQPMFWTEAMVLQAFLAFNRDFEILLSLPMIRYFEEEFLKQRIPIYQTLEQDPNAFSSMWLRRSA